MAKSKAHIEEFDPRRVRPLPDQPRKRFRGIKELADSIAEVGQLSPGIVTPVHDDPDYDAQLVDGERRLRACRAAGVPFRAEVRPDSSAEETFVQSFAANFGKQDHDVIEIAHGLARMQRAGKTAEQMGRIAGRSTCWVVQHLNIMKLHPDVQAMMVVGDDDKPAKLTFSIAQLLAPVPHDKQLAMARRITKGAGMSLAAARRFVLKQRSADGDDTAYVRGHGRQRSITTIESIAEDVSHRIGVYLDMPGSEINRLIDAVDHSAKRQLIAALDQTAEDLGMLAEAIRSRLPKLGQHGPVAAAVA